MEAELQAAVSEYRAQLASLGELLAADPRDQEVREVYEQLQGALSYTLAALEEQQQQEQQQQQAVEAGAGAEQPQGGGGQAGGAAECGGAEDGADGGGGAAAALRPPRGGAPGNARMHPANLYYHQEPNFVALAQEYDELRPYVSIDAAGRAHLQSTSWAATRALTTCLLARDFGLRWGLPEGQLVPPVPNRANYLHWMHDLLGLSAPEQGAIDGPTVRGLDIGCGANFIYCLLGAALYGWKMVGVDVTQVAVQCCKRLIEDNPQVAPLLEIRDLSYLHPELQGAYAAAPAGSSASGGGGRRGRKRPAEGRGPDPSEAEAEAGGVETAEVIGERNGEEGGVALPSATEAAAAAMGVVEAASEGAAAVSEDQGILLPVFADENETFAFTMCNPPFFESMQEAAQNPNTAFGGTAAEMVCPGGELVFVLRMVVESEELRDRVHWFSTMVGKKNTLKALRRELHSRHVTALRTTELAQGKTSRWAMAWSWQVHPNKASQPLRRLADTAAPVTGAEPPPPPPYVAGQPRDAAAGVTSPHKASGPGRPGAAAAPSLASAGVPLLPRRHISFTVVQAGALNGRTILGEVRRLLSEAGCGSGLQVDAATWSLAWPLQVGPFSAPSSGGAEAAGSKRPREGDSGGANGGPGGSWASAITARLRIAQSSQRGRLELVASLPNDAPDAAARAFTGLMAELERGLAAAAGGATR